MKKLYALFFSFICLNTICSEQLNTQDLAAKQKKDEVSLLDVVSEISAIHKVVADYVGNDLFPMSCNPIDDKKDIRALAFLDNNKLVCGYRDGSVVIWDWVNAKILHTLLASRESLIDVDKQFIYMSINAIIILNDGTIIVNHKDNSNIHIWRLQDEKYVCTVEKLHNNPIRSLVYSKQRNLLISTDNTCIKIRYGHDLKKSQSIYVKIANKSINCSWVLKVSPNGTYLAFSDYEKLRIYNLEKLEMEPSVNLEHAIFNLEWLSNASIVLSLNHPGEQHYISIDISEIQKSKRQIYNPHDDMCSFIAQKQISQSLELRSLKVSAQSSMLALPYGQFITSSYFPVLWDSDLKSQPIKLLAKDEHAGFFALSSDGQYVAAATADSDKDNITIWSVSKVLYELILKKNQKPKIIVRN
jgi:WD40 repeat protein